MSHGWSQRVNSYLDELLTATESIDLVLDAMQLATRNVQSEKIEAGQRADGAGHLEWNQRHHRRQAVGQDMPPHDPPGRHANDSRRLWDNRKCATLIVTVAPLISTTSWLQSNW